MTEDNDIEPIKTIGLLGGMSSQATKEYYHLINSGINKIKGAHHVAELMICSVNFNNIERFVRNNEWAKAGEYLSDKAKSLEAAGADYLFLGTNTMHKVREKIKAAISIPFIDIFEITAQAINKAGTKKVGLLGTYPTMSDPFYRKTYEDNNIEIFVPNENDKQEIDRIIFNEMCHNKFLAESKEFYINTVGKMISEGVEGIILGCTEIKMLINQNDFPNIKVFDTTTLHCEKAIELSLS